MNKRKLSDGNPLYTALILILICGTLVGLSAWSPKIVSQSSSSNPSSEIRIRVKNFTQSFTLIDIQRKPNHAVHLTLRNDYQKNITAFAISPGNDRYMQRPDFLFSDYSIAPGQSHIEYCTLPGVVDNTGQTTGMEVVLSIRAVLFQDGTSDGDEEVVKRIVDTRLGKQRQMHRILALLRNTLTSSIANSQSALHDLKSRVIDLPVSSEEGVSVYFKGGLHNAKENMIRQLQQLEFKYHHNGHVDLYKELTQIKSRYERMTARLSN